MKAYVGYVVGKEETNPVSVWFPGKSGYNEFKSHRGFGSNTGNLSLTSLYLARKNSEKCFLTTELSDQGPYIFDEKYGVSTKEDNAPYLNMENTKNVVNSQSTVNMYSSPGDGEFDTSAHSYPALNWLQTFYPEQIGGCETNNYDNAPGGNYVTLSIGTRVLVLFPENASYGYIIRQIPYDDEMSKVIKNLNE